MGDTETMIKQNEQIIALLQQIKDGLEEVRKETKITSDFATLRSEIIKRTKGQQVRE